ncbi:MAG: tetratricopeptide repeat protein [Candidatus Omnitrophica bacterium]|nr:tetratricopeptide repeat protein [Candidatus Omnitrophota bacterium]
MQFTFDHLLFPETDLPLSVYELLQQIDKLCALYHTIEDKKELVSKLHSLYWQSIVTIVPSLFIDEKIKGQYSIPPEYHNWLNFGCVSATLCPSYKSLIKPQEEEISENIKEVFDEYTVIYVHEWLEKMHDRDIRVEHQQLCNKKLQIAQEDLDNYPSLLENSLARRDDFLRRHQKAYDVINICKQIDARMPDYYFIKNKIECSQRITPEQKKHYVQLYDEINNLQALRDKAQYIISDTVPQSEMAQLDQEIDTTMQLKIKLERNLENAQAAVDQDKGWRESNTASTFREFLREEVRRVRTLTELAARRTHIRPCSILLEGQPIVTPAQVVSAIEEILEVDPTLFSKKRKKQTKFPTIFLIPIYSDGIYDYENNALLIPIRSPRGLLQSVAAALIEFHLESETGRQFRDSYEQLRKGEGIFSTIKLRERMLRDYIEWVTLEAKGYQVLEKDTRKWFYENVAPPRLSLKHPRRLGQRSMPEFLEYIEQNKQYLENEIKDFDVYFSLGIALWHQENFTDAHRAFVKAFELQPQSDNACYNAALSAFKTQQKEKASEYFKAYLRIDRSSFWVVRVQLFLNELR